MDNTLSALKLSEKDKKGLGLDELDFNLHFKGFLTHDTPGERQRQRRNLFTIRHYTTDTLETRHPKLTIKKFKRDDLYEEHENCVYQYRDYFLAEFRYIMNILATESSKTNTIQDEMPNQPSTNINGHPITIIYLPNCHRFRNISISSAHTLKRTHEEIEPYSQEQTKNA
ncbi:MAG: hypothetical protein M1834_006463 [Cirrosporium novae-zelandiae]|nr:MAG: hypothetical protein M1834_006463 [Cirrosporium novae-zelandiae]